MTLRPRHVRPEASAEEARRLRSALLTKVDEWLERLPGESPRLLDLGCGDGWATHVVRRHLAKVRPGVRLWGLDLDLTAVLQAGEEFAGRWLAADVHRLPLADRCIDGALALNVFHGTDRGAFARGLLPVLRPGGVLLVYDRVPTLMPGVERFSVILDRSQLESLCRLPTRA